MKRRMKMLVKVFPLSLIILDILAACVYAYYGDARRAVYWLAAAVLTITVAF